MQIIGHIESCFLDKNGTPRQGQLCPSSRAQLRVTFFNNSQHSLEGLEGYSHVWLVFLFHANHVHRVESTDGSAPLYSSAFARVQAKVTPPKKGEKLGVFATRSPHRPSPIGLSLVKLDRIQEDTLFLSGVDLMNGTPILDIKPFLPTHDVPLTTPSCPEWVLASPAVPKLTVAISPAARQAIENAAALGQLRLFENATVAIQAMTEVLREDPRSSYRREQCAEELYKFRLDNLDVHCLFADDSGVVEVVDCIACGETNLNLNPK
eukprot:c13799_g1_i1.p1 GENE.c13799_g1_i1~~c13799_g1_i1.p1  ORF type:complete len:265 (+),score=62.68 c13799_g1_i1:272-1066(+)